MQIFLFLPSFFWFFEIVDRGGHVNHPLPPLLNSDIPPPFLFPATPLNLFKDGLIPMALVKINVSKIREIITYMFMAYYEQLCY